MLSVRTFRTEEEAVAMANDTTYGLADGVFSQVRTQSRPHCPLCCRSGAAEMYRFGVGGFQDVEKAKRVANKLRAGILYINQCMTGVGPSGGGFKMSGIGREGGMEGLMEYVQSKSVSVNTGLNRPAGYAREVVADAAVATPARL